MHRYAKLFLLLLTTSVCTAGITQEQLSRMPRYGRYDKLRTEIGSALKSGAISVNWAADGHSFTYHSDGKILKYNVGDKSVVDTDADYPAIARPLTGRRRRSAAPERGRQNGVATSPDEKLKAINRDRNLYLVVAGKESPITTDGSVLKRIKYGTASWVYGEELGVTEAMWWSPDSKKLAYYRFDESQVLDYFLGYDQTLIQSKLDAEPYPKAGAPNPIVSVFVYDVATKKSTLVNTSFGDLGAGHYVYDIQWSPKGNELMFNRTNRKQDVMDVCAANPTTGQSRVVLHEEWKASWVENHPPMTWLEDKHRFILQSERSGFKNYYLCDFNGKLLNPITQNNFDADGIVLVDEAGGYLFYTCRGGDTPYLQQFHRVGLDGRGDILLTDPKLSHSVNLAPDGAHFIDVASTVNDAPSTRLVNMKAVVQKTLATSDLSKFNELGLKKTERFAFTVSDGTTCYGTLSFPSDFDPSKKYPVLVSVYGGPESSGGAESFRLPNPLTELGFLCASIDGRGTGGRGKAFKDAVYGKLGIVEIDDQAAGVKALGELPYVNAKRVGIYGTSYGGYSSAMAILRYPELFEAASASSAVTQWRNYDSIYTERFMNVPQDNAEGYDNGSAMKYAGNLKGHLLLYFGTADNNVHPSNTVQLVQALNRAGKHYDMQMGADLGHTGVNQTRMIEYFMTHLILRPYDRKSN